MCLNMYSTLQSDLLGLEWIGISRWSYQHPAFVQPLESRPLNFLVALFSMLHYLHVSQNESAIRSQNKPTVSFFTTERAIEHVELAMSGSV